MRGKPTHEYSQDFYAWALHNATLIRQGKLAEIDLENMDEAYEEAVVIAISETGMDESEFPKNCPFDFQNCLDQEFFPG